MKKLLEKIFKKRRKGGAAARGKLTSDSRFKFTQKDNDIAGTELTIHRMLAGAFQASRTREENERQIIAEALKKGDAIELLLASLMRKHNILSIKLSYSIYDDCFFVNIVEE